MSLTPDTAYNAFTSSVACIGSTVCQMGMGDSQSLLTSGFEEMATQYAASDALPQIYISGCPSSCGTHQIGELGFRGTVKVIKVQHTQPSLCTSTAAHSRAENT